MRLSDVIKERVNIVDVIGEDVSLRKQGRSHVGFCPFHSNTRTPAFHVYPDTCSYHCFSCKASGDVFGYIMRKRQKTFAEALRLLGDRVGVAIPDASSPGDETTYAALARAAELFARTLAASPHAERARAYLETRGISASSIERFQIGYSLQDWTAGIHALTQGGDLSLDTLVAAGLAIRKETGRVYDAFRGRLMFPIHDQQGRIVGFGGRALADEDQPKYLNTAQSPTFDKQSLLYGLHQAGPAIRETGCAVIVEGYLDVVQAHQRGYRNVVAPLGTSLSAKHGQQLQRYARRFILALDGDKGGRDGTLRAFETLWQSLDRRQLPSGSRHGRTSFAPAVPVAIDVVQLADDDDPDRVLRRGDEAWEALLASARPAVFFYADTIAETMDLSHPSEQAAFVERLAPALVGIASPVERASVLGYIAKRARVPAQVVQQAVQRRSGQHSFLELVLAEPAAFGSPEQCLLRYGLEFPSLMSAICQPLEAILVRSAEIGLPLTSLPTDLLVTSELRQIWERWCALGCPHIFNGAWTQFVEPALEEEVRAVLLLDLPPQESKTLERTIRELVTSLLRPVFQSAERQILLMPEAEGRARQLGAFYAVRRDILAALAPGPA